MTNKEFIEKLRKENNEPEAIEDLGGDFMDGFNEALDRLEAQEAGLREALKRISEESSHVTTRWEEGLCSKTGIFCAVCVAEAALAHAPKVAEGEKK